MNLDKTNWPTQRWLAIGYAVAIAALIINSIFTYWNLSTVRTTWDTFVGDREFLRGIDEVLSDLKDAETGQRGYVLTGDERYLDGLEAVEVARAHKPEFVLLDIGLPGMDGYEVAAKLRQDGCCRGTVFIAISGYGQDEDRRRSKEAGFDYHLVKPIDHDALLTLLSHTGAMTQ